MVVILGSHTFTKWKLSKVVIFFLTRLSCGNDTELLKSIKESFFPHFTLMQEQFTNRNYPFPCNGRVGAPVLKLYVLHKTTECASITLSSLYIYINETVKKIPLVRRLNCIRYSEYLPTLLFYILIWFWERTFSHRGCRDFIYNSVKQSNRPGGGHRRMIHK